MAARVQIADIYIVLRYTSGALDQGVQNERVLKLKMFTMLYNIPG